MHVEDLIIDTTLPRCPEPPTDENCSICLKSLPASDDGYEQTNSELGRPYETKRSSKRGSAAITSIEIHHGLLSGHNIASTLTVSHLPQSTVRVVHPKSSSGQSWHVHFVITIGCISIRHNAASQATMLCEIIRCSPLFQESRIRGGYS